MSPLQLALGEKATITAVNTNETLRKHLYSLGVCKGSQLKIESTSLFKGTYCIRIDNISNLAFRRNELAMIEVAI
ncbi:MAG TPA: ferrous iron transport protein A [Campylobacterales bacterium]|nr:ferrous iron transport protein A [Campylobacterales bacterium]